MVTASRSGKVLLVAPPFQPARGPNLGVSQLKANLEGAGHPTEVLYLNFQFATRVGLPATEFLCNIYPTLLGEYVFAEALFPDEAGCVDDYVKDVLADRRFRQRFKKHFPDDSPAALITRWRAEAIAFCDGEGLKAILDRDPWLVGFTSTFQQNCAGLALLNRLKRARPEVVTAMGGANCDGEMGQELMACFPAIDYLGQGESDHALVALADALADGKTAHDIPGMHSRTSPAGVIPGNPLTGADLDDLPYPDFDDYFTQRAAHGLHDQFGHKPRLPMETSRGCWWGAKKHCTFCGLNGQTMAFRSKSPGRVLDEIDWLVERHDPEMIWMADNILDMAYFKSLLPRLAESRPTSLFYEIKANLTREQVRLLADAGVKEIQPGIESLCDESLRLMRKGVTQAQNLQLLKWGAEFGVDIYWNFLTGFPGENDGEIADLAKQAKSLHHLEPPSGAFVLHLERFSPYFNNAEQHGLTPITPHKAYRHIYPFSDESLARIAYFFESDVLKQKNKGASLRTAKSMVKRWREQHRRSFLFAVPRKNSLVVIDTRRCGRRWVHRLTGLRRAVYEHCDSARTIAYLTRELGEAVSSDSIEAALQSLVRDRLVLRTSGRYLSLGVEPVRDLTFYTTATEQATGVASYRRKPARFTTRQMARRLRSYRRDVRDRWIRRFAFTSVRLLSKDRSRYPFAET